METRASDERLALECGFAGQETTGPAGFAMAQRTIPVVIAQAKVVQKRAPEAWIINFTNPAGIITQAVSKYTGTKIVGICDTPTELFHRIARSLGEDSNAVHCDYFGLNHLGWVKGVSVRGIDVMTKLLDDDPIRSLYPAKLFHADLLRLLGMIPTEYLFFYYNQKTALEHQLRAGVTRGQELCALNFQIWNSLETSMSAGDPEAALRVYRKYLNSRNSSYMRLEGAGEFGLEFEDTAWDPFEAATGYHRIAVDTISALSSEAPRCLILNVANQGSLEGIGRDDFVEVPCMVNREGAVPQQIGGIPDSVRGLLTSVKQYERLTIQAAVEHRRDLATLALTLNPIVGSWDAAGTFLESLAAKNGMAMEKRFDQ